MAKTKLERITSINEEIRQLENQRKQLLQAQKEQERKDRVRRFCKRAALLESLAPDTILLTDERFNTFLEKTILTEYAKRILVELKAKSASVPEAQTANSARGERA